MRPLPDGFADAHWAALVARAHGMAAKVEVLLDGQVVNDDVEILSGTVTMDATAARYARLNCTIATPDRLPATPSDRFAPSGYELRVSRGIRVPMSVAELATWLGDQATWLGDYVTFGQGVGYTDILIRLGVFPIAQATIDVPGKVTTISAWDRSWRIQRARFEDYYDIASNTNYATAINDLLADRWPGVTTNFPSIDLTTPHLVFDRHTEPWGPAQRMGRSCGYRLRFDGAGQAILVPVATFASNPVGTLTTTRNALRVSHTLDAESSYNAYTVQSANASNDGVYEATVTDDDPDSVTWWDGPYGHVPAPVHRSEYATSEEHCAIEAASKLAVTRGLAAWLTGTVAPDPRWEPDDVVLVDIPELGLSQPHILDSVTLGLTPRDAMSVRTRTRQVVNFA